MGAHFSHRHSRWLRRLAGQIWRVQACDTRFFLRHHRRHRVRVAELCEIAEVTITICRGQEPPPDPGCRWVTLVKRMTTDGRALRRLVLQCDLAVDPEALDERTSKAIWDDLAGDEVRAAEAKIRRQERGAALDIVAGEDGEVR